MSVVCPVSVSFWNFIFKSSCSWAAHYTPVTSQHKALSVKTFIILPSILVDSPSGAHPWSVLTFPWLSVRTVAGGSPLNCRRQITGVRWALQEERTNGRMWHLGLLQQQSLVSLLLLSVIRLPLPSGDLPALGLAEFMVPAKQPLGCVNHAQREATVRHGSQYFLSLWTL